MRTPKNSLGVTRELHRIEGELCTLRWAALQVSKDFTPTQREDARRYLAGIHAQANETSRNIEP